LTHTPPFNDICLLVDIRRYFVKIAAEFCVPAFVLDVLGDHALSETIIFVIIATVWVRGRGDCR